MKQKKQKEKFKFMKKLNKQEKTKELFISYLKENNVWVFNDSFLGKHLTIRPPKNTNDKLNDYYINDILATNFSGISNSSSFLKFISYLLQKNEHSLAIQQSIKKTNNYKNYNHHEDISKIIKILTPYKKTLFEFSCRNSFLNNHLNTLPSIFSILDSQEYRIGLLEAIFNTTAFNNLDNQKMIYNLVQTNIKNPKKFDNKFSKIKILNNFETVVDFIETPSIIVIGYNAEKLIGANLLTKISSDNLLSFIPQFASILRTKHTEELKIINTIVDYNKEKKQYYLNIICKQETLELNKVIFENFLNTISRFSIWQEITDFLSEEKINLFLKTCKSDYLQQTLQKSLSIDICNKQISKKI